MSADVQRWSKRRKMEAVLRLLRGETLDEVSRDLKVEISRLEAWRDKGIHGIEEAMKEREGDPLAPKRILRLMRENALLSPQRAAQGEPNTHDGTILTTQPLEMWGTDGTTTQVVEEGTVWIFGAVEHFNAECVGIHASKSGDRFNAMELKHFGIRQSLAYVGEPQTNGVIERFWKTLKKQVLEGRIYQTLADLRVALAVFMDLYNRAWRLEKLGGRTPDEARQAWETKQAA